jgi:hypothetical protein
MLKRFGRKTVFGVIVAALVSIAGVTLAARQVRQAWLFAHLSPTERAVIGAWSWTYHSGTGRIVFTADHKVKEGFPRDDKRMLIRDSDFAYGAFGTWRLEGDVLVMVMDLDLRPWAEPIKGRVSRSKVVTIDQSRMTFEDGSRYDRMKF